MIEKRLGSAPKKLGCSALNTMTRVSQGEDCCECSALSMRPFGRTSVVSAPLFIPKTIAPEITCWTTQRVIQLRKERRNTSEPSITQPIFLGAFPIVDHNGCPPHAM